METVGKISQIMGAVVDVTFEDGQLPEILNALEINQNGDGTLILETGVYPQERTVRDHRLVPGEWSFEQIGALPYLTFVWVSSVPARFPGNISK